MQRGNLLALRESSNSNEEFESLLKLDGVRIERIVSQGQASPEEFWYDQPEHEWVALLTGAARIRFEYEVIDMAPGDFVFIPAHRRHRVEWTSPKQPTVWLAIHFRDGASE